MHRSKSACRPALFGVSSRRAPFARSHTAISNVIGSISSKPLTSILIANRGEIVLSVNALSVLLAITFTKVAKTYWEDSIPIWHQDYYNLYGS